MTRTSSIVAWAGTVVVAGLTAGLVIPPLVGASKPAHEDKASYLVGFDVGKQLKTEVIRLDLPSFMRGVDDGVTGRNSSLTDDEAKRVIADLRRAVEERQADERTRTVARNRSEGTAFLARNGRQEGVTTLQGGVQRRILKSGGGARPSLDDTVVCNYSGMLTDGTEFANTFKDNQPVTFAIRSAIKGWAAALPLMNVGARWQLVVPPELAYGERGAGRTIGPGATLVFEVELLAIKPRS